MLQIGINHFGRKREKLYYAEPLLRKRRQCIKYCVFEYTACGQYQLYAIGEVRIEQNVVQAIERGQTFHIVHNYQVTALSIEPSDSTGEYFAVDSWADKPAAHLLRNGFRKGQQ